MLNRLFNKETNVDWLADYLRLEYGEYWINPFSIKARHLTYLGEYNLKNIPTKYWSYPTSDGISYATFEELGSNERCAGMTDEPPPNQK